MASNYAAMQQFTRYTSWSPILILNCITFLFSTHTCASSSIIRSGLSTVTRKNDFSFSSHGQILPQVSVSLSKSNHKSQQVVILKTIKSKWASALPSNHYLKILYPYHSHHQRKSHLWCIFSKSLSLSIKNALQNKSSKKLQFYCFSQWCHYTDNLHLNLF